MLFHLNWSKQLVRYLFLIYRSLTLINKAFIKYVIFIAQLSNVLVANLGTETSKRNLLGGAPLKSCR